MAGLKEWFKQDWVDIGAKKKGGGFKKCGRKSASGSKRKYPNCVPAAKAARMTESQRRSAVARKRRKAQGDGGKPTVSGEKGGGGNGYVLITATGSVQSTASTSIVSNAFTAASAPTSSRIVVFQENVGSITLNTDIIASISRDGGTTFTTATLSDSGYVVGSSGQRILTGTATVSGQPSGTSMRWKLALANNAVKIHGVSLQWK